MADVNKELSNDDCLVYALVANIPPIYHASDLRNYFSQFLEQGGFDCFHFRHRPEIVKCYNHECIEQVLGVDREPSVTCPTCRSNSKINRKTMCCVIRLRNSKFEELSRTYDRKCWLDRQGESVKSICCISKIKVADVCNDDAQFKTRGEKRKIDDERQVFTRKDLLSLPELHPPALMPHGNVGTTTSYFLKQIQLCRLPSSIIAKLGLVFPRTRSNKKYGSVPFTYHGTAVREGSASKYTRVSSGKGHDILSEEEVAHISTQRKAETIVEDKEKNENADESESDADDCEEWERHEAFHDDPSNQDRNTERLYESQMEIVWEKGGPGIVWYTDAQFWDELSGNEEEKDVDEWDLDMGVYYERDDGDKDARDMMTMRRDVRRRQGLLDSPKTIGNFERHTKGIGRKLMTKYGWREGQGLGSSITGIVDALDDEGGQKPYDKRGIGYHGEKLNFFGGLPTAKPARSETSTSAVKISTVYDDPAITDPTERLLRRNEPTHMKHRIKHAETSH